MSRKILIVDDALADRQNLERIVIDAGHLAVLAESGEQAIQRAQKDKPDVILMDVNMPGMDGYATTRLLKADAATKDIPIIFVTGKSQKADLAWGQILGAKAYVPKPYTREQILDLIKA
jgi:twitching motility two-component system response regulator PilH